jgi:hypothetical protein
MLQFVILGLATVAFADDLENFSSNTNQAIELNQKTADDEVRTQLDLFESGKITLDEITTGRDEEWGRKLIAYYLAHTASVTTKKKLPVSRCLAGFGKYPEALQLAENYVTVYSNDWQAWRIIGGANVFMTNWSSAMSAYTNAVLLGDSNSWASLGFAALKSDHLDVFRDFVPRLFLLENSQTDKDLQAAGVLVIYSLRTEQKDIFVKAVEGVNPKDILAHDDVTFLVKQGCEQFKGKDIDKIRQEMESATSSTNNVSSPSR